MNPPKSPSIPPKKKKPSTPRKRKAPFREECDCGNKATIIKFGTMICKRCDDIDSNRPLDHLIGEEETGIDIYRSSLAVNDEYLDEEFFI